MNEYNKNDTKFKLSLDALGTCIILKYTPFIYEVKNKKLLMLFGISLCIEMTRMLVPFLYSNIINNVYPSVEVLEF